MGMLSGKQQLNPLRPVVEYLFEIPSHLQSVDQPAQQSERKLIMDDVHNGGAAIDL